MPQNSVQYQYFVDQILPWFEEHGRHDLPWRKPNMTAYHVWVSEIMLQQTQVNRVTEYYTRLLSRFPTVQELAKTNWETFLPYYQGLGYYQRGRNMLKTAQAVAEQYNGEFPQDPAELEKLPGIGPYTARAIASFAYHQPYLAFDTNQQRVWGRYLFGDKKAKLQIKEIESVLQELTPPVPFHTLNAAIMDFANLVYTNRNPEIEHSPLQPHCVYCQTHGQLEEQTRRSTTNFPKKDAQTWLFLHRNHTEYYSPNTNQYQPFMLPAPLNTRARIKAYFEREYGLQLSIRPPYKKAYVNETPMLFTRAQILLGQHNFTTYSKSDVQAWLNEQENDILSA